MGIGDWGLGVGANPQSPIPNPPTPIPNPHLFFQINMIKYQIKNNFNCNKKLKYNKINNKYFFFRLILW